MARDPYCKICKVRRVPKKGAVCLACQDAEVRYLAELRAEKVPEWAIKKMLKVWRKRRKGTL